MSSAFDLSSLLKALEQEVLFYEDVEPMEIDESTEELPRYFEVCLDCSLKLLNGSCNNCGVSTLT